MERHFRSLFNQADKNALFSKGAALAKRLLSNQSESRLLHGDIHHGNILNSERGWLAIDPKGVIGERSYEVANTLCNPIGFPAIVHNPKRMMRLAAMFASVLALDKRRIIEFSFAHACLSACWFLEDGMDADEALETAKLLDQLIDS